MLERWAHTYSDLGGEFDEGALIAAGEAAVRAARAGYRCEECLRIGRDVYFAVLESPLMRDAEGASSAQGESVVP